MNIIAHAFLLMVASGLLVIGPVFGAERGTTDGEWRTYGGDLSSTKFAPLASNQCGQFQRSGNCLAVQDEFPGTDA